MSFLDSKSSSNAWLDSNCKVEFLTNVIVSIILSILSYQFSVRIVPRYGQNLFRANIQSKDLNKKGERLLPEGLGIVTTTVYIVCIILFIPFAFMQKLAGGSCIVAFLTLRLDLVFQHFLVHGRLFDFDPEILTKFIGALLSISFICLVGFADDVIKLNYKQKVVLSSIASLPILMVYYTIIGGTNVVLPCWFQYMFVTQTVRLGIFYYIGLMISIIFCCNVINILSGINGVETGESLVICLAVIILNIIEMNGRCIPSHMFSIYFMIPFLSTTCALLRFNWYPATIYVGRTYCYVAGMAFSVVAILGRFNITLFFFFLPQALNFFYSLPQLLGYLPSLSRSRLPWYNDDGKVEMSSVGLVVTEKQLPRYLRVMRFLRLVRITKKTFGHESELSFNNLTLSNFILMKTGPLEEKTLAIIIIAIQVINCVTVLLVRYGT